jgi:diacylglycerol kinase family enzyme
MDALSWFLCSVNLGIGASVAQGSNGGLRRYLGDGLGTLVSLFKTVVKHTPFDITCTVDGEGLRLTQVLNLTIGKNPYIASGIRLGVPIEPDDGTLYLFAARGFTLWGFLARLPMLYRGTFQDHPNNYSCKLKSFSSPLLRDAPAVEFDGDPRGFLPCAIRVLPKALTLVVPVPTSSDGDAE